MMTNNTKLEDKIEGDEEFRAWKYIQCFSYLKKNDLENNVKEEVADPKGDEDKAKHKKDLVKSKRIISVSIRSHMYQP